MSTNFLHGVEVVQIDDGLRSISTVKSSIIGLVGTAPDATAADYPLDTPVLITGPRQAAKLGVSGTLKDAYMAAYAQGVNVMVVVRVDDGADAATTLASVVGDSTEGTGVWALLAAGNITGQVPRILAAPGFTSNTDATVSPATSALISVAERLRAIVVADGPNTTEAAAIADAAKYGSDRLYIVDPAVQVYDTTSATYERRRDPRRLAERTPAPLRASDRPFRPAPARRRHARVPPDAQEPVGPPSDQQARIRHHRH